MRKLSYLLLLIISIFLISPGLLGAETWFNVQWISDGDTIVLGGGERVRYNGINAPEIAHEDHRKSAEPHGNAAKRFNIKLVKAKKVRLEFDIERRDRYGRLLAYVFLSDGTFVNVEMVANGVAYFLEGTVKKRYGKLLLKAQREAMSTRQGLWRDLIENGERYIGNRRSKRFHLKTCPFAKKIKKQNRIYFTRFHLKTCPFAKKIKQQNRIYFTSRWDAFWAGYAPAKRCIEISELFGKP
jgi:micrococcal nuclease